MAAGAELARWPKSLLISGSILYPAGVWTCSPHTLPNFAPHPTPEPTPGGWAREEPYTSPENRSGVIWVGNSGDLLMLVW